VGFDSALMAQQQRAAKVAGFIVRVGSNAEQSVHVFQNKSGNVWWPTQARFWLEWGYLLAGIGILPVDTASPVTQNVPIQQRTPELFGPRSL